MGELNKLFSFKAKIEELKSQNDALQELVQDKDKSLLEKDKMLYQITNEISLRKD